MTKPTSLAIEAKARRTLFRTVLGVIAMEAILLILIFGDPTWRGIDYLTMDLFYLLGFIGLIVILVLFIVYMKIKFTKI